MSKSFFFFEKTSRETVRRAILFGYVLDKTKAFHGTEGNLFRRGYPSMSFLFGPKKKSAEIMLVMDSPSACSGIHAPPHI